MHQGWAVGRLSRGRDHSRHPGDRSDCDESFGDDTAIVREVRPEEVLFPSASGACAAWWYAPPPSPAGDGAPAVVMGNGFSMTRHDGLRSYAEAFAAAGIGVLVFDYRHFGDSQGQPRQRF